MALLFVVALAVRVYGIGRESLWLDEDYTLVFSQLPVWRLILVGGAHEHPPLFYLLVHWALAVNHSYLAPRLLAAMCGAAGVPALYALGRKLFGSAAGLIAAALLAISPIHLWQSQDGRAYEPAGLLVVLSYLSLLHALDVDSRRRWAAYVAVTLLALYMDYTAALALLPQGLYLVRARQHRRLAPLSVSWLAIGAGFAAWLPMLARNTARVAAGYWIPSPTPSDVANAVEEYLGLVTPCPTGTACTQHAVPLLGAVGGLLVVLCVLGTIWLLATSVRRRELDLAVVTSWLLAPCLLLLVISLRRPLFLDRYLLCGSFALYLLIGRQATSLASRRRLILASAILAVLVAGNVYTVRGVLATPSNPDWISPMRDFAAAYRPGQVVALYPGALQGMFRAYLPPSTHVTRAEPIWLETYLDVAGREQQYGELTDYQLRDRELTALTRHARQVWLIEQEYAGTWDVWRWFVTHGFYQMVDERYAGGTYLQLWDRRPTRFGAAVLKGPAADGRWQSSNTARRAVTIRVAGRSLLERSVALKPGDAYSLLINERSTVREPRVRMAVYTVCHGTAPAAGAHPVGVFPRLLHFDLWANGHWTGKRVGFVAPPGARCGVLSLSTSGGTTTWGTVALYREAG